MLAPALANAADTAEHHARELVGERLRRLTEDAPPGRTLAIGGVRGTAPAPQPRVGGIGVPLRIGNVQLATNLLLAPIANYCDLAFRIVCREQGGLGLACTDLLSPHGLLRGTARSLDLASTNDLDKPVCMQLYGAEADILADGARWAVDHGATVIDINMGCPVDKVTKKNGGSMLLCDPRNTVRLAEAVVKAADAASSGRVPVTAKMRLGWTENAVIAPWLARELERIGIQLVTVHGRTTQQMFKGQASRPGIRRVVEAVEKIPVIGNGDVTEPQHVIDMIRDTGCAGVMIGRGALAAPWLFRQAWAMQKAQSSHSQSSNSAQVTSCLSFEPLSLEFSSPDLADPTEAQKLAIIRRYFALMLEFRDERYAMNHIRRRIAWFAKKLGPCKPLRERIRTAPGPAAVLAALDEFEAGGLRRFPAGYRDAVSDDLGDDADQG